MLDLLFDFFKLLIKPLIFKPTVKIYDHSAYTQISINIFFTIFFTGYKNEWKEHKLNGKKITKSDFYKNKKQESS